MDPAILVIDDSEDDVIMIRAALRNAKIACRVYVACDGEGAIAYLKGEGKFADRGEYPVPDLVLLDLKMPKLGGFEVLRWLRQQPQFERRLES